MTHDGIRKFGVSWEPAGPHGLLRPTSKMINSPLTRLPSSRDVKGNAPAVDRDTLKAWQEFGSRQLDRRHQNRIDTAVMHLIDVAYATSQGIVTHRDFVHASGGETPQQGQSRMPGMQAAHNLFGQTRVDTTPLYAAVASRRRVSGHDKVAADIREAMARTEVVPTFLNRYIEGQVERLGARDAQVRAAAEIVHEQSSGRPVNPALIQHVVRMSLLPGVSRAYQSFEEHVIRQVGDPSPQDMSRALRVVFEGPSHETVLDSGFLLALGAAQDLSAAARRGEPLSIRKEAVAERVAQLEASSAATTVT